MAQRPTMDTPVTHLIFAVRAVAQWYERNASKLEPVLGPEFAGKEEGEAAAQRLEDAQTTYQVEMRDDVAWTNEKDALVAKVGPLEDAITAGVEMAYYDDENLGDMLSDFDIGPASRIKTLPAAREALQTLLTALRSHEDKLRASMGNYGARLAEVEQLQARAGELFGGRDIESLETDRARRERKRAREACLEFVDRAVLAARMARVEHPELVDELDAVFADHVPQRTRAADPVDEPEPTGA
ncbi:hypothetical protein FIV42_00100 [Persicimonas caeni]|uniref:Uncharacterized protein n=1 Tax=Persicimonas caeni TaxID=2292766 RepID=A0A4Y6PLJ1_PERCE|nr:hypothetical protein [Persicimonas caeni]QDG49194.1 hypothetical protein FIV42_00100 [Persicimonas caeni]QED30415.1 hypothetical protein FRD00_00095 [Persicimonas caeni]